MKITCKSKKVINNMDDSFCFELFGLALEDGYLHVNVKVVANTFSM